MGEICVSFSTGPFGTMLHKADYVEKGGVPLVNPANIKNGYIDSSNIKLVSREKYSALQAYVLAENDVIIARRGDLRKCAVVSAKEKGWLAGTGAFFLHTTGIDTSFFKLFYTSSFAQNFLLSDSIGTTMDNLNQSLLSRLPFPLPPLAEQKRIVAAIEKFMPLIEEYGKKETELKAFNEQIGTLTKKAILQEAFQGRLLANPSLKTSFDLPGNGPSCPQADTAKTRGINLQTGKALLEEIRKEKARLIKEGKLKKEKPLPEITEDEIPFEIPGSWCWCRLGEIVPFGVCQNAEPQEIDDEDWILDLEDIEKDSGKILSFKTK
ncbi:restriction endonuclease subunit S, partial [uncultured Treponema sp.]|uniref:restriction endonuclease subunit S n=1 Tax=uncultured Treponema sp. TaxID=162155 RepID=UPI0025ECA747